MPRTPIHKIQRLLRNEFNSFLFFYILYLLSSFVNSNHITFVLQKHYNMNILYVYNYTIFLYKNQYILLSCVHTPICHKKHSIFKEKKKLFYLFITSSISFINYLLLLVLQQGKHLHMFHILYMQIHL